MTRSNDNDADETPWYRDRWLLVGIVMLLSFAFTACSIIAGIAYLVWMLVR